MRVRTIHGLRPLVLLCGLFSLLPCLTGCGSGAGIIAVSLSSSSANFNNVQVGTTSSPVSFTFANTGTAPVAISAIATSSAAYAATSNCPMRPNMLGPGGSCAITVTFAPSTVGPTSDTLKVMHDAPGSPSTALLSGTGTAAPPPGMVTFSAASLSFTSTTVGQSSATQSVTLTNAQTAALTISGITAGTADYQVTNTCPAAPATLAAGGTCVITVAFKPTTAGPRPDAISVADDGPGSPQTVGLSGTGTAVPPPPPVGNITFSPTALTFASTPVGQTSAAQNVTLTNTQTVALTISSIAAGTADYQVMSTCPAAPATLAVNGTCVITVAFKPSAVGARPDAVSVTDDGTGSPQTVALSGTGTATTGSVTLSPTALTFPSTTVGQTSATQNITLTNRQTAALTISAIAVGTSDYQVVATDCPATPSTLVAGGTCLITVAFTPTAQGARPDVLTVADDGPVSPQAVSLSGTGTAVAIGSVTLAPTSLSFAKTQVGQTSGTQSVNLTNNQSVSLTISSIMASTADYQVTGSTCSLSPLTVDPGATCSITVAFKPTAQGARPGTLTIADDGPGNPQTVALSGTGTAAVGALPFSPTSLTYASTPVGVTSPTQSVTLTNTQTVALTISSIAVGTADYQITATTCPKAPATLAANGACTITVAFKPTAEGARTDEIAVTDDGPGSPQTVALSGTGAAATGGVTLSPMTVDFPSQSDGSIGGPIAVSLSNGQTAALNISSIQISAPFSQTNNCGTTVAAGQGCTINVSYAPTAVGASRSSLVITDDARNSPQSVAVTGNSVVGVSVSPKTGYTFFHQIVKTSSTPLVLTVTNNQTTAVTINSITSNADYPFTTGCVGANGTGTLMPQSSCQIAVSFVPQAIGSRPGAVLISESADASPLSVPMAGTGIAGDPGLTVTIGPNAPCVFPGGTQQFTAFVSGTTNQAVTWFVDGTVGGKASSGTITTDGLYTAPAADGTTHTIRAASQESPNVAADMVFTITSTPVFAIYPFTSSLPPLAQQPFQAQVCYVPDPRSVTWSVDNIPGGSSAVGTITNDGIYSAPATAGKHIVRVTDATLNRTSGGVVTVFSAISADFGSRTNPAYPIRANLIGAGRGDAPHSTADRALIAQAGVATLRLYGQIPLVFATQTPDWTKIDPLIASIQAAGQHVLLQMAFSPPWLQPNPNPCGAGNTFVSPTDNNAWGQILAQYVAHMDAAFPGFVRDYEIWNEPNASGICTSDHLNTYLAIYGAAAPLMKAQAAADGVTINIGGPVLSGYSNLWITNITTNPATAPYVDFLDYHQYFFGTKNLEVKWDTYNGDNSVYQLLQDPSAGAAANFTKVYNAMKGGSQPLGANTPIYVTEFNTNFAFFQDCCRNDPTFAPIWNALYVSDILNTAYSGLPAPGQLDYFASSAYPYFCLIGIVDQNMDCNYPEGSTPQPYPQYFAFQLMFSNNYLGLVKGGFLAPSVTPPLGAGGLAVLAYYNVDQDSMVIINPTATAYTQIPVNLVNVGFATPNATLYQIVNGASISSTAVPLTAQGANWTVSVDVPAYSVQAISLKAQ